jgi:hypothetical protein
MTLDAQRSLIDHVYSLLTADTALKAAMGGSVRAYPVQAYPDSIMPYIVHRFDLRATDSIFPLRQGTYVADIWSDDENTIEILGIRKALVELIDNRNFSNTEISQCRISLQYDNFVPDDMKVWHYVCQFNVRFYRKTETGAIITRVDS